jgi:RimJ/RimL family protein N-acetyltransferase
LNYDFTTKRLIVKEWHSFEPKELEQPDLVEIIEDILEPEITKTFPIMWRGKYDKKRAKAWIDERDSEAKTLLAVEKDTKKAVGFINFFREGDRSKGDYFRIGYVVSTVKWGKGVATELVESFVHWCKENNVSTVTAAVDPDNVASIRVLQKNNFSTEKTNTNGRSLLFYYDLMN